MTAGGGGSCALDLIFKPRFFPRCIKTSRIFPSVTVLFSPNKCLLSICNWGHSSLQSPCLLRAYTLEIMTHNKQRNKVGEVL